MTPRQQEKDTNNGRNFNIRDATNSSNINNTSDARKSNGASNSSDASIRSGACKSIEASNSREAMQQQYMAATAVPDVLNKFGM